MLASVVPKIGHGRRRGIAGPLDGGCTVIEICGLSQLLQNAADANLLSGPFVVAFFFAILWVLWRVGGFRGLTWG